MSKDLLRLTRRSRNGAISTQKNRQRGLAAMAQELNKLGYKLKSANALKPKHVLALLEHWQTNDVKTATIRNRMSWLRWWTAQVNKANVIERANKAYGVGRQTRTPTNRAQQLDKTKLQQIDCPYIQVALLLQATFGLRREEAMKFQPSYAVQQGYIRLKPSWTKGRRARKIPITNEAQRQAVALAQKLAGRGSLIPTELNYRQHLKRYEHQTQKAGMRNTHGLRHNYAQERYQVLTGKACPLAGGKHWHEMTTKEQHADRAAREQISKELGHQRLSITDTYLGRALK